MSSTKQPEFRDIRDNNGNFATLFVFERNVNGVNKECSILIDKRITELTDEDRQRCLKRAEQNYD